ncbi:hypothetical protein D9758_004113 [Tetrapyrgos nigripes]|uniref:Sulfotransferase n=1 Tax=Tetrapyrgos nigripes TaxID=182062 RepID=A0A8H5GU70_9AGAR|nr:hypothetical protein D9758_004113 [Tetrapyrgos nigripes]
MNTQHQPSNPLRLFIFGHPRTRTNLFCRLWHNHPDVLEKQYPLMEPWVYGPERQEIRERILPPGKMEQHVKDTFQAGFDGLQELIAVAEAEGKLPIVKEHVYHMMDAISLCAHLSLSYEGRPKPSLTDRQLDIPESERVYDRNIFGEPSDLPIPNPTILPERFLKTLSPIFVIRHPAKAFPSYLRVCSAYGGSVFDDAFRINASYKWQRLLYDCYDAYFKAKDIKLGSNGAPSDVVNGYGNGYGNGHAHSHKIWPVVLNGDDLVVDAERVMQKLCCYTGLDASKICYSWESEENTCQDAISQALWNQVQNSTGIIKDPTCSKPVAIAEEAKKWTKEWDEEVAKKLAEFCEAAMDDYKYLLQFSI